MKAQYDKIEYRHTSGVFGFGKIKEETLIE